MTDTLLDRIEQAEREADEIRAEAQREARDITKAVEEANQAMERQQTRDMQEEASRRLESAREAARDEIKVLEMRQENEREAFKRTAQARVSQAGRAIFERIVKDGSR